MNQENRSFPDLVRDLVNQVSDLFRHEIALARADVGDRVSQAAGGVGILAAALVVGVGAMVILLLAAVEGLDHVWPRWLAALVVGVVAAIVAAVLAAAGRSSLRARSLVPQRTISSVKEDARYAKEKYGEH